jgi:hypothetical protein
VRQSILVSAKANGEDAEKRGVLRPGMTSPMTIVEPTGGNPGIGLAHVVLLADTGERYISSKLFE